MNFLLIPLFVFVFFPEAGRVALYSVFIDFFLSQTLVKTLVKNLAKHFGGFCSVFQ